MFPIRSARSVPYAVLMLQILNLVNNKQTQSLATIVDWADSKR